MAVKFRQTYKQMVEDNRELFEEFGLVHAKYALDQAEWQEEFNRVGGEVMEVVREYEDRLCRHSEKGKYARYSANLSEKFRGELKKDYPMVDFVGVKTELDLAFDGMKKLF